MKDTEKNKEQLIAELAESEEKYRIQVEMAADAVFLETVEGRILECNTAGAKMFGYTKEEIAGLTIADLVPEEFAKTLPKIVTEKETTYGKFVARINKKKDGTIFPTEIATRFINIGDKPRLIVYIRDITERKRAEKKRKSLLKKEREQHLKAETLAKVALILTSKLSLSDVLEEILRQVKRLVPYSACNIVLIKKGRLGNVHSQGYDKYGSEKFVNNFTYPVEKLSLDKEVIKSAKPRLISDTHQNPRWIIFKETSWVKSCLIVPICLNNKVIGFLNLDGDTPGKFVKDDIEKLQPLVNAAAIALENARLFEEVRKEITERKKAEKALVESEEKYRGIFENTGTAVIIIEEDKTISMANTQFEKLSGYSKEEIENKIKWTDFVIPENLEKMKKYHIAKRKAGENPPIEYEFCFMDRKGKIKNIFLKVGIIPGSKKSIASLIDITGRKQAEERVRFLSSFVEQSSDGMAIADLDGNLLFLNEAWAYIHGYKDPEELSGKHLSVFHNKEQLKNDVEPFNRVVKEKGFNRGEVGHIKKDGTILPTHMTTTTLKDKNGNPNAMAAVARNITELKIAEEKLQKTYQKLKKTMNAAIDTMSRIIEAKDPYTSGHQHRVCQLAVPLAQELGLSEDKIEGVRIASLIHDIGKIGLPTEILSKPSKLTDIEFSLIKGHSQIGYDILKSINFSYPIASIVLQHHERIDGTGYPNSIKADKILIEACILGVADVVEAMSSHRPYRPALGIDKALEEITKNKGTLYDPEVVKACLKLFKEKEFKFE